VAVPLKSSTEISDFRPRLKWIFAIAAAGFAVLIFRLFDLQALQGEHFLQLSKRNFVRKQEIPATRGVILDRKGRVLVDNRPSYDIRITPAFVDNPTALVKKLKPLLDMSKIQATDLGKKIIAARGLMRFRPITAKRDVGMKCLAEIRVRLNELDGVDVMVRPVREYIHGTFAAHLLGTLGEINSRELKRLGSDSGYKQGDMIGRRGVEKTYESLLKGKDGFELIVTDSKGRKQPDSLAKEMIPEGTPTRMEPRPGRTLKLTIDSDLQNEAEAAFGAQRAGALVAIEVQTGKVRAYLSRPSFDPNDFAQGITPEKWKEYRTNRLKPLMDRAGGGAFFPGSTYKLITAVAGLSENVVKPEDKIFCPGYYKLGRRIFRCWKATGHGYMDAVHGIQHSCDVYFYHLGEMLGPDKLSKWAFALGLGHLTGIPLPGETAGTIPTRAWYLKVHKQPWQKGDSLSMAIGQGDNKVTVLQLARAYATVANGGRLMKPYVLECALGEDGNVVYKEDPVLLKNVAIRKEVRDVVMEGLTDVVNEPGGTAYYRRIRGVDYKVAGKTGTAQVLKLGDERQHNLEEVLWWHRDHALFVGVAPVSAPDIAVAVVVEHGGHGSSAAAPIVMRVIKKWMEIEHGKKPKED